MAQCSQYGCTGRPWSEGLLFGINDDAALAGAAGYGAADFVCEGCGSPEQLGYEKWACTPCGVYTKVWPGVTAPIACLNCQQPLSLLA